MKDYFNVEPDAFRLMNKHFNHGRAGHKIRYIVRHHFAGIGDANTVWGWWQTRQASAHYVVETSGRVVQMVYDRDTAWHAGNLTANRESIGIEHANSGGGPDWPIPDATVDAGAKLAAALCYFYKLGRPHYGTNIRDHRSFFATSCPHHLAAGGRYHDRWMRVAQEHYDWMVRGGKQEGFLMALNDAEQRELLDHMRVIRRELTQLYPSRSAYRAGDEPVDTLAGMILNVDGRVHEDWVHARAKEQGVTPDEFARKLHGGK